MNRLNRFFWFCSGAHLKSLEEHGTEHNKYVGIGATIFFTGLFAALSGGYAMYFVFAGEDWAVFFSILFGILWGLAIFNMDRYIVSSINKSGSTAKQLLQASPRILLAVMIGIVIARPLELKIFNKEIKDRLKISYLNTQRASIDTLNKAFEKKYQIEIANLQRLKNEKDSLEKNIKSGSQKLNFEIFGNKTSETSGIQGYGTFAKRKEAEIKLQSIALDTLNAKIEKGDNFINERKKFDGLFSGKLYTTKQLDSLANNAGFADRNSALGKLSYSPDGKYDSGTAMAITFIGLLFIFFECLPVFVKLMSQRGPYDYVVNNTEEKEIYKSTLGLRAAKEIMDGVYPTRVETEIETRKTALKNDSFSDLNKPRTH